jgi:energy-coupling factor transporter transmembrane protein EcfT
MCMSFILNHCVAISMIFVLIFFVSIDLKKRISALLVSLITLSFGLFFLIFYASTEIRGFEAIDVQIKGLIIIGEGLILLVITSIFIVAQELKKKTL